MSGIMMMIMAGNGGTFTTPFSSSMVNTGTTTGTYTASMTWNSDGSMSYGAHASGTSTWFTPTTTGIGSLYWIRLTANGAVNTSYSGMTPGTWYSLSAGQTITVQNSGTGVEGTGSFTIAYATDSGGSNIVATLTAAITWDVGKVS